MFCFCFNAIPKPAPRRRCSKRTGSLPCWDRPLAGTSREIGSLLPKLHGPHRNDVGTGRAKAGPASLPCSPRTEGPPFSASSPRAPCPGQGCTPAPRGVAAPPRAVGPARLPLCQRGPSDRCCRSGLTSQDASPQDVYAERNSPWVLLTHTLAAVPGPRGSGRAGWPPAICGPSVGTAATSAWESG